MDCGGGATLRIAQPLPRGSLATHRGQEELFDLYAIPRAPSVLVQSLAAARRAARELGFPIAAKIVANDVAHKSDIGGVFLDIKSQAELDRSYAELDRVAVEKKQGILIQKMVQGDCELLAGAKRDQVFGPVILFGLGGIYVEIIRDSVLRLAPFSEAQAKRLMEDARFYPIIAGARGKRPINLGAVARILSQLSILAVEQPEVKTVDLNPIIATSERALVVDAKIGLR